MERLGRERDAADQQEPDIEPEPEEQGAPGWAERNGIDLNEVTADASDKKEYEELQKKIDDDPLGRRAHDYGTDVWTVMRPVVPEHEDGGFGSAPPGSEISNALEIIWALAHTIGAKVHRAISSLAFNDTEEIDGDPIQNDANGSAKVARLAIADSLAAWTIVREAGVIDPLASEYLIGNLKQVEFDLTARFPYAIGFVRPGFDEEIPGIVRPWTIMATEEDPD
jgi:hypothetical protein